MGFWPNSFWLKSFVFDSFFPKIMFEDSKKPQAPAVLPCGIILCHNESESCRNVSPNRPKVAGKPFDRRRIRCLVHRTRPRPWHRSVAWECWDCFWSWGNWKRRCIWVVCIFSTSFVIERRYTEVEMMQQVWHHLISPKIALLAALNVAVWHQLSWTNVWIKLKRTIAIG